MPSGSRGPVGPWLRGILPAYWEEGIQRGSREPAGLLSHTLPCSASSGRGRGPLPKRGTAVAVAPRAGGEPPPPGLAPAAWVQPGSCEGPEPAFRDIPTLTLRLGAMEHG